MNNLNISKQNMQIIFATVEDAREILNIYSYYVKNNTISFGYKVPTIEEFKERIRKY